MTSHVRSKNSSKKPNEIDIEIFEKYSTQDDSTDAWSLENGDDKENIPLENIKTYDRSSYQKRPFKTRKKNEQQESEDIDPFCANRTDNNYQTAVNKRLHSSKGDHRNEIDNLNTQKDKRLIKLTAAYSQLPPVQFKKKVQSTLRSSRQQTRATTNSIKKIEKLKNVKKNKKDQKYKSLRRNSRVMIYLKQQALPMASLFVIHPETLWRSYWDLFVLLLVCYNAVVVPVNLVFDSSPFNIFALELLFNAFFMVDIGLQFFTTFKYDKGPMIGRVEMSHPVIIKQYLRTWFIIDLMASLPIDLVVTWSTSSNASVTSFNYLLRLLRGFKFMRILRMSRIWKRLLYKARINVMCPLKKKKK
ncbi:potassium/sodium hyperpolarization-activated cyclic nucleotide-gated channel 3 [Reticulomyxa filosa]|uniref:Potassium/sodium hyperpolarization-activated cyclic nucleotide-gated channel 3 n=1 Tax=Reticulomyxa filosa TaxID=46433 RepID=X6N6A6_RETFI|nr:potassium/sodium hyperpolarization-activated cyclic nucleotide-gated channel 3 [Reticulomyxa filosa]|eukprot:ETO21443.1 potassium/sodium hyperpolarization-activated cyclic nucleotide-gated channel 3 [Reticulomyxa filosa]